MTEQPVPRSFAGVVIPPRPDRRLRADSSTAAGAAAARRAAARAARPPRAHRRVRLWAVLLVPFLVPMLASTALVAWLAFHDGRRAVNADPDLPARVTADTRQTALLCLAAFAAAAAVGVVTSRWIGRQIQRIESAARGIADGDLDQRVDARGVVELEHLAASFNRMAAQLKESFTALEASNDTLRIAEENYRDIIENCVEGIFQSTIEGTYLSVNNAMARIHGYASPEEMLAHVTCIGDQVYVDPASRETFKRMMAEQNVVRRFEYQAYRRDRSVVWIEENTRAVRDNTGGVLYYEGMIHDVTDRKQQEEALHKRIEELKVEIDHQKRKTEVEKITQSGYFQDLVTAAATLREDEW